MSHASFNVIGHVEHSVLFSAFCRPSITSHTLTGKVRRLVKLLRSKSVEVPVYVRFMTCSKYMTLPVASLRISSHGIQINDAQGESYRFVWEDLLDIILFADHSGRPYFLPEPTPMSDNYDFDITDENEEPMKLAA